MTARTPVPAVVENALAAAIQVQVDDDDEPADDDAADNNKSDDEAPKE